MCLHTCIYESTYVMCYPTDIHKKLDLALQKLPFMRFSRVLNIDSIPLQDPAVVCHHVSVIPSLVKLFHPFNVLMKQFSLLIRDVSKVYWEFIQVAM